MLGRIVGSLLLVASFPIAAWAQYPAGICPLGSVPVAGGGGMMCQCPDGSFASYGVACGSTAQPQPKPRYQPPVQQVQGNSQRDCAVDGETCCIPPGRAVGAGDGEAQASLRRANGCMAMRQPMPACINLFRALEATRNPSILQEAEAMKRQLNCN